MRVLITILLIKFCACSIQAQNLIPNPSFEDTVQLNFGLTFPRFWTQPTNASPNHYIPHARPEWQVPKNYAGYQYAHAGNAYMGILMYSLYGGSGLRRSREYIQIKLDNTLKQDSIYCFRMYVSLADSMRYASKGQLGVYFSNNEVGSNNNYHLPYTPQITVSPDDYIIDKVKWLRFDFEYMASGGEEYITIGNFNDTTAIDTLFVDGGSKETLDYIGTYYYIDDLFLGHCDSLPDTTIGIFENELKHKLKLYPNPVGEHFYLAYSGQEQLQFQLYNLMGQKVEAGVHKEVDRYRFSTGHLPKGVYLLVVLGREERMSYQIIKE